MRTVIFDLDGTLADTSGDLLAAGNACFREMGHGDLLDQVRDASVALYGGKALLRCGLERVGALDETVVERFYPVFLDHYRRAIDTHTFLFPGAMAAVREMKVRGLGLGVCTNKPEGLADILLRRLGVREDFASLIGADTLSVRKPHPEPLREAARRAGGDPARTVLVGDSDTDSNTAKAAGVPFILVGFGPSESCGAVPDSSARLLRFEDLPELVDQLTG